MAEALMVDGRLQDSLPATDRGLAYGDGVFRTLRIQAGQPVAWPVHMQRLVHDCERLGLPLPDATALYAEMRSLLGERRNGVFKIVITRGSGGRGYTPPSQPGRRILSIHRLPVHARAPSAPLALTRSAVALAEQPRLAGVKHLNRLEQVLARAECARNGHADALMCDTHGRVIATTMRNMLFRDGNGQWTTPALTRAGIAGATRQRLMAGLAERGEPVAERDIHLGSLARIDAAVACNSIGGAVAVRAIEGRALPASEDAAAVCRRLLDAVDAQPSSQAIEGG